MSEHDNLDAVVWHVVGEVVVGLDHPPAELFIRAADDESTF